MVIAKRLLGKLPLFVTIGCVTRADAWMECVRQRGGEYLLALVIASGPAAGHGSFVGLSSVPICDYPACRRNHAAGTNHVSLIASVLRLRGPSRLRVSGGWLGFQANRV